MKFETTDEYSHEPEDLIQIPGHSYHIHKQDIIEGNIPLELSVLHSILDILRVDPQTLSDEQILLSCEKIYDIMIDMIEIGQFEDNENTLP